MSNYSKRTFWLGAAERALKTAAQVAIASIGTATLVTAVPWSAVASTVALAVVMSVLTSLADPERTDVAITTGGTATTPAAVGRHEATGA
jgi:hypothetical protein